MRPYKKNITMRMAALLLVMVMGCIQPMNGMSEGNVKAASSKKLYVREVKLFIKNSGSQEDAQKWCDSQDANKDEDDTNDWEVVPGDLNEGASGSLKKDVAVFLCYQKTNDPNKAITDMAVMNERGNYSEGAYEQLLNDRRDSFKDMVDDLQSMLKEYRINYNNGVATAIWAHDYMNNYIEDDSGKLLGDLLLTISDDDLVDVFLQANGQVIVMMHEQLAFACDTHETTWLDRMEKLGSYKTLRNQYYNAYGKNAARADAALKQKYQEKALAILDNWDDIHQHLEKASRFYTENGLDKLSDDELFAKMDEWAEDAESDELDTDTYIYVKEQKMFSNLMLYNYEEGTLYDFFAQSREDVSGDNITKLYPLAASMTEGQIASINESVSFYEVLMDAFSATILNDTGKGKAAEINNNMDAGVKKETDETIKELKDNIKNFSGEPISVYNGVDRGMFEGGVAVTSAAEDYSNASSSNWAESFVESGNFTKTAIGMAAGAMFCAGAAIAFSVATEKMAARVVQMINDGKAVYIGSYEASVRSGRDILLRSGGRLNNVSDSLLWASKNYNYNQIRNYKTAFKSGLSEKHMERLSAANKDLMKTGNVGIVRGLKIGFAVVCVLLAIADIIMTSITLYNYYNVEHIPIPNYMVDLSYNEGKKTSYINYKSVPDQNNKNGDLNGGGGKQWLALYATHDPVAGKPILAPEKPGQRIIVKKKDNTIPDGYMPLHLFGKPSAAQNLTFASSNDGWSYNDKAGGIYLFFERDANAFFTIDDEEKQTGTVFSTGKVVLFTGLGVVLGLLVGCVGTFLFVKKKEKTVKQ